MVHQGGDRLLVLDGLAQHVAVVDRSVQHLHGQREVRAGRDLALFLGAAQSADRFLDAWVDQFLPQLLGQEVVVVQLGEDARVGGAERRDREQFHRAGDMGAQVGADIAGVHERGGVDQGVRERLQQHGALRRPPAVDRLLADPGAGRDGLYRDVPVPPLRTEVESGPQDRAA